MKGNYFKSVILPAAAIGLLAAAGAAAVFGLLAHKKSVPEAIDDEINDPDIKKDIENDKPVFSETPTTAELVFDSFDGGGPEYTISIEDSDILSFTEKHIYSNPDHDNMCGSGYDVVFTFSGIKPGNTDMTVFARSPIADNYDIIYTVSVSEDFQVTITEKERKDISSSEVIEEEKEEISISGVMVIEADEKVFYVIPEKNTQVKSVVDKISGEPLVSEFEDNGENALIADLPCLYDVSFEETKADPGSVVLTDNGKIAILYEEVDGNFCLLGKMSEDDLESIRNIKQAMIWMQWDE